MRTLSAAKGIFMTMVRFAQLFAISILFLATLHSQVSAQDAADGVAPEAASGVTQKELVKASRHMVAAANPHASKAGNEILKQGGNAVDAMVVVQLVLGLVEPQSSGLGGGAFLVYFDADANRLTTYDGRETAPAAATADMFIGEDGQPMRFFDAVVGGRSVGTPGTVKLLHEVHRKHGKLEWSSLFDAAIALAENGFEVSPRLNALITRSAESLFKYETTRNYFLSEEAVPLFVGTKIRNPEYAATLKAIAANGPDAFYSGDLAKRIVDTVQNAEGNPGRLSLDDLANYQIIERDPVCYTYRKFEVCGMGPPSSGALTVGQILGMLEPYDLKAYGMNDPTSWRLFGDASRLAFADRGLYMADSDFVKMPKGLLNREYLWKRGRTLTREDAIPADELKPGEPPFDHAQLYAPDNSLELPSTSHFSIVDDAGNVVSMTTTIENGFGSRLMVGGFLLNNELTDFSFVPEVDSKPVANRIEPGKRPRSSMAPTIILRDGKPVLAIGSPGGSRIIPYVAKTIIGWIDWELDIQQAIELPHLVNRFGKYDLETGTSAERFAPALADMGYEVEARELNSGLHGIEITSEGLEGGVDPRREGLAIGE
ncbi:MAG: gamma-glutamyltransferase [Rhizobiaceae bacterium]|nr:gamma-glutamyltransferase [Rhizobiaceae bacterium]